MDSVAAGLSRCGSAKPLHLIQADCEGASIRRNLSIQYVELDDNVVELPEKLSFWTQTLLVLHEGLAESARLIGVSAATTATMHCARALLVSEDIHLHITLTQKKLT